MSISVRIIRYVHVYISNIPQVRGTVEERIGIKFEVFKVLIYRVTPSGQGSDGCYHIKVIVDEVHHMIHNYVIMDANIRTNNNFVKCLHLNAHNSVICYR